ncbi:hypothetical protein [Psychroflexus lacisalsi]|jgi:hypothetical protein|uniref:Uncharacterized protein n=1 Tax=Psychroflexus lacisalsi TaxID=503928 RepID=A0ABP3VL83_9FLAO|nr:hypothetical protein [Psychroflexus lacisalsi]MBZ9620138.1 hypothetical protein [Psychroflexus lacisalsi]
MSKKENPNIGENTRWDKIMDEVKNGATIPKPPTSLTPKEQTDNKRDKE